MLDTNVIYGFLIGTGATVAAAYRFLKSRISPAEAADIYAKAMKAINDYRTETAAGQLTADEKIRLAEEALAAVQAVVEALATAEQLKDKNGGS